MWTFIIPSRGRQMLQIYSVIVDIPVDKDLLIVLIISQLT